jgi:hypothetical protein
VAQNGDPREQDIAFAQNYFAVQTRKADEALFGHPTQAMKETWNVPNKRKAFGIRKLWRSETKLD